MTLLPSDLRRKLAVPASSADPASVRRPDPF